MSNGAAPTNNLISFWTWRDLTHQSAGARTQSEPDPHLATPLSHSVGNDAPDPAGREHHGYQSEGRQHQCVEARCRRRTVPADPGRGCALRFPTARSAVGYDLRGAGVWRRLLVGRSRPIGGGVVCREVPR